MGRSFYNVSIPVCHPLIEERMPVWKALSELFLDIELNEDDSARIASTLAASPYSEEKIEEILRFEVTPALKWNLLSVAGEWEGFEDRWLREKIAPRLDKRPFFRFGVHKLIRDQWVDIKKKVSLLRTQ